eukprot:929314-Pyramimonas_sp.AAC.1
MSKSKMMSSTRRLFLHWYSRRYGRWGGAADLGLLRRCACWSVSETTTGENAQVSTGGSGAAANLAPG